MTPIMKHPEKYLTTQFQTQAMNTNYTDLHKKSELMLMRRTTASV